MKKRLKNIRGFISGAVIGILGGLMGLGGAEFRLPVLVGYFKFTTPQAIIINLIVSLSTVFFSFIFRSTSIPISNVLDYYHVILNLLPGSLVGAFLGVRIATKISSDRLNKIVFLFLLLLGLFLITHAFVHFQQIALSTPIQIITGVLAGLIIGLFSSMLGVAGGELIIPIIILLFAVDIKLAGSLSLCISFPTVIIGILKYRSSDHFKITKENTFFIILMSIGSVLGAFIGSRILIGISEAVLQITLGIILLISSVKIFLHRK